MKVFKLAVGFAAGYVLGTRAGREKYEQIAATARKASTHPTVVQAQEKAKALLATGQEKIAAKLPHDRPETTIQPTIVSTPAPAPAPAARTKPTPVSTTALP
ncbi:hypothetical protein [Actinoplanes sp. NPDC051851]|uniref:hypothetical protein n=1 Tax=Actinoplanes sp. NPDC051851 TaxID=3154753 RepID=UPI00344542E0